jgi:hypothetical protein
MREAALRHEADLAGYEVERERSVDDVHERNGRRCGLTNL